MIRLSAPIIEEDDLAAVAATLTSGYLVQGERVAEFEETVARIAGTEQAVAVSNGTAALHLALLALGVGTGDLVVTTTYSWPSTANVIELCGARPVFVDIDCDTFNLAPVALEQTLERLFDDEGVGASVKALLPVHAFGQTADMEAIGVIAGRYGLPVVEDAACAIGAAWAGRPAGALGTVGCFSFHPRKAVTTGEGGMVVTDEAGIADAVRVLRDHGQVRDDSGRRFVRPGFNYRMTEFQAALGGSQVAKLGRIIAARRRAAAAYHELLAGTLVDCPVVASAASPVYQSYVVLLPHPLRNEDVIPAMGDEGVETTIGTWHLPLTDYYRSRYGYVQGDFPATDSVFSRALTLPLFEAITCDDQDRVVSSLLSCVAAQSTRA